MEKSPTNKSNFDVKEWFTGVQEELEKERKKTQEDYDREEYKNIGKKTNKSFIDMDKLQEELRKERAKTQEDYDKE